MKIFNATKVLTAVAIAFAFSVTIFHPNIAEARPVGLDHAYVATTGSDASPCTTTAPCRTFAAAYAKTSTGGEIDALNTGDFGPLQITGAITIVGTGVNAGVSQSRGSSSPMIVVEAGLGDVVNLIHLDMYGNGNEYGIMYVSGSQLNVVDSVIESVGYPISVSPNGNTPENLVVKNTTMIGISGGLGTGVVTSTGATVTATLSNVSITAFDTGVSVANGNVSITNSDVSFSATVGLVVSGGSLTASHDVLNGNTTAVHAMAPGIMNVDSSTISGNGVAVAADSGSNLRIHDNSIYDNMTAITCGTGPYATVNSSGDNRKGQNKFGTAPNCPVSAITTITLQ